MNGITFVDTVTQVPSAWANTVNTLTYNVFAAASTVEAAQNALRLKTLAYQAHNNVRIEGGNLDGVYLGSVTPIVQLTAQSARVLDNPVDDKDVVNKGWLEAWVQNVLGSSQTQWTNSLGNLSFQNANNVNIKGGTVDNVDIGLTGRASGRFTSLKVSNPPLDGDDVVTLGHLTASYDVTLGRLRDMAYQAANAVAITGGEIDNIRLGLVSPVIARLSRGSIQSAPLTNEDIVNKRYSDSNLAAFSATLGTMAYQAANNVAIIGGAVNNTNIGLLSPAAIQATDLTVVKASAWLDLRTISDNVAGIRFQNGNTTVGTFSYVGGSAPAPNNILLLNAITPIRLQTVGGAVINLNGNTVSLNAPLTRLAENSGERVVIGTGAPRTGPYPLTVNARTWLDRTDTRRAWFEEGLSEGFYDSNTVNPLGLSGTFVLPTNNRSAMYVALADDATIQFAPTTDWPGLRVIKIALQLLNGATSVTWPTNVYWTGPGGVPPNYVDAITQQVDMIEMWTFNGGLTWLAQSSYSMTADQLTPPEILLFAAT